MFPRRPSPRGSDLSAFSSIAPFRRALARRSSRPRDGSRFLHRQALGFDRQVIFAYCDELRECPNSVLGRSRIHLVAGLESPHARSDSDYDACQLVTENERQSITQEQLEFSVSDLGIQWIHASSVDLDQDVILPHFRVWNFAGPHAICASIAIDDECFHVAPIGASSPQLRHSVIRLWTYDSCKSRLRPFHQTGMQNPHLWRLSESRHGRNAKPDIRVWQSHALCQIELGRETEASRAVRLTIARHQGEFASVELANALRSAEGDHDAQSPILELREACHQRRTRLRTRVSRYFRITAINDVTGDGRRKLAWHLARLNSPAHRTRTR